MGFGFPVLLYLKNSRREKILETPPFDANPVIFAESPL